jgi:hypothetical protein
VMTPSNGRSGVGLTIFASTWAMTLRVHEREINTASFLVIGCDLYRVLPRAHSTQPNSGPYVSVGRRDSNGDLPSSLSDSFSALNRNSRSGIEGDGGRIKYKNEKRLVCSLVYA